MNNKTMILIFSFEDACSITFGLNISIITTNVDLRGLNGYGHFLTVLIAYRKRVLYKKDKKIPKFRRLNIWIFYLLNNSLLIAK